MAKAGSKSDKVVCRTPSAGKKPTRIDGWKYDLISKAIKKAVPRGNTGVEFRELPKLVKKNLSPADQKKVGSISWYTTVVKLEMEVKGELERIPGVVPQRLRLK